MFRGQGQTGPARARAGVVPRRKDPGAGAGPHAAGFAAEEGPCADDDSRLQTQWHDHAVCCTQRAGRPSHQPMPHPRFPRSPGTLSAISLKWVSAISGMRTGCCRTSLRMLERSTSDRPVRLIGFSGLGEPWRGGGTRALVTSGEGSMQQVPPDRRHPLEERVTYRYYPASTNNGIDIGAADRVRPRQAGDDCRQVG